MTQWLAFFHLVLVFLFFVFIVCTCYSFGSFLLPLFSLFLHCFVGSFCCYRSFFLVFMSICWLGDCYCVNIVFIFWITQAREQSLQQQLTNLQNELRQAKENFTPEMRHFEALQSKITAMEQRFNQRESDLERIISNAQIKSRIEKDESESQWKLIIKKKNQEIERFREELDAILEALRELKRQGVVIPMMGNWHY